MAETVNNSTSNQTANTTPQPNTGTINRPAGAPTAAATATPRPTASVSENTATSTRSVNTAGATASVSENTAVPAGPVNTAEVNEAPENTAEVNEQQPAAEVNEDVNYDTLSVSEQADYINILEEKGKRGLLSVDEQAIINKAKDLSNSDKTNSKKTGDVGPKDGDEPNDPDPEKKGPFKEEDIIKYMYNDWLLGGANWLWTKTAAKLDKGYYWSMRKISERRRQRQIERGKTYDTETSYNKISDKAEASGKATATSIDKHREEQLKNLKLMREGKIDEANVSDVTKVLMKNMDERERQEFCAAAEQGINNFYDRMTMADQFANNYAQAGMALDLAQNKDAYAGKNLEEEFAKQKEKALILYGRLLDQEQAAGRDPDKMATNLFNASHEAVKEAEKTMDKGQFNEKGNKPRSGLAKNIVKISKQLQSVAKPKEGQQRGLFEAALEDQKFDRGIKESLQDIERKAGAHFVREHENSERRGTVKLLKEKLGLTKENTDAFSQQYQQHRRKTERAEFNHRMAETLAGLDR